MMSLPRTLAHDTQEKSVSSVTFRLFFRVVRCGPDAVAPVSVVLPVLALFAMALFVCFCISRFAALKLNDDEAESSTALRLD
jgi:hypothetical protein